MIVLNNISLVKGFEIASNVLQYAMPACAWILDIAPDVYTNNFEKILKKSSIVGLLIIAQNRGGQYLKNQFPKKRPNGNDIESFPSGHMMIAAQSAVHLIYKCGLNSQAGIFAIAGTIIMGIGRYLPGHQDIKDLTAEVF